MDSHRAALLECRRLNALLEESYAKLLAQHNASSVLQEENLALKHRVEELEHLNSKRAHRIEKLKASAAHVKELSLQLALVEEDVQRTQATIDRDTGHALLLLREIRLAIQKLFASDLHISKSVLPSLCHYIDQASRALTRISSKSPSQSHPHPSSSNSRSWTAVSSIHQAEAAATERYESSKHQHELRLQLTERAREAQHTQLYVKALEGRLSVLEAEITQLRSQASSTYQPPSAAAPVYCWWEDGTARRGGGGGAAEFAANNQGVGCKSARAVTKPLQGTTYTSNMMFIICG